MLKHYDRENLIWGSDLQANEKLFLLALNSFVDANGECYPGLELLARMTGFTERTARNIRDRLKAKCIITTNRRHTDKGWRTSDRYKVDFSTLSSLPEISSTGNQCLPENGVVLPENDDKPTGKSLQSLPEGFSRDLSSINYPERSTQLEQGSGEQKNFTPSPVPSRSQPEAGEDLLTSTLRKLVHCTDDYTPSALRMELRFTPLPWLDDLRMVDPEFAKYVGKEVCPSSPMNLRNSQGYVENAIQSVSRLRKVIGLWQDYIAKDSKTTPTPKQPSFDAAALISQEMGL
jgi:hypothetical protein